MPVKKRPVVVVTLPTGIETPEQMTKFMDDLTQGKLEYNDPQIGQHTGAPSEEDEQPIIEVSQNEVKKALKVLLSKQNDVLAVLYQKHEAYNEEYFGGRLSVPLLTIDKMSNKTLGNYTYGSDSTGLENHIRMNINFIALNTETRILETLKHEMIHQWQDEVLYEKKNKDGSYHHCGEKRPKEWHNKDFKEKAQQVDIPALGKRCYGNPAHMPEAKSYNRKFACGCIATNGHPLTIWSTRAVKAICEVCGERFDETKKAGIVIPVTLSHIERLGEDAVMMQMLTEYRNFQRFAKKLELQEVVNHLKAQKVAYKEGIYQKGHRAYSENFHYWVAFNGTTEAKKGVGISDGEHTGAGR